MTINFANLPPPAIIETISAEAIIAEMVADVTARFVAAGISYDVGGLETDPVKIIIEAAAAREVNLRARINDAAKANLVKYATGTDLDNLAAFYDVVRLSGELDPALQRRVIIAISGRSTGGPRDWYRSAAMRASVRVKDAAVYRVGTGPDIRVAVLATDNFGEPDAALLAAVRNVVTADDVRVISDRVEVLAATSTTVNVSADIWLQPDAPQSIFAGLEAALRAALQKDGGLGFNVTPSWLVAQLHQPGVHKVILQTPTSDVAVDANSAVRIGTVALTYKGRDF